MSVKPSRLCDNGLLELELKPLLLAEEAAGDPLLGEEEVEAAPALPRCAPDRGAADVESRS